MCWSSSQNLPVASAHVASGPMALGVSTTSCWEPKAPGGRRCLHSHAASSRPSQGLPGATAREGLVEHIRCVTQCQQHQGSWRQHLCRCQGLAGSWVCEVRGAATHLAPRVAGMAGGHAACQGPQQSVAEPRAAAPAGRFAAGAQGEGSSLPLPSAARGNPSQG